MAQPRPPAWLLLFPLALVVRLTNLAGVFRADGVFPINTDSYYHLRRIVLTFRNYPRVPDTDRYLNFPNGGQVFWTYGFDWMYATFAKVLTLGAGDDWWIAALSSLLTPVIGSVTVCLIFAIVWELEPNRAAWVAGGLAAILPALSLYSTVGYIDHNMMESAIAAGYLLAYLRMIRAADADRSGHHATAAAAVLAVGAVTTTVVSLLVTIHAAVLVAQVALSFSDRPRVLRGLDMNLRLLTWLLVFLAPFVLTRIAEPAGVNPARLLAGIQVWLFAGGVLAVRMWPRDTAFRCSRLAVTAALVWAAWGVGLVFSDVAAAGRFLLEALSFLRVSNPLLAMVVESERLFSKPIGIIVGYFTALLAIWPVCVAALFVKGRRSSPAHLMVGLVSVVSFVPAALQVRFMTIFAVFYCVSVGIGIGWAWRAVAADRPAVGGRLVRSAMVGGALALAVWPSLSQNWLMYRNPYVAYRGPLFPTLLPVIEWMRDHTPQVSVTGAASGDYGVMSEWIVGHWIVFLAGRPVVGSPLCHVHWQEEAMRDTARMFMSPPSEAIRRMRERRIRFVVLTPFDPEQMIGLANWDFTAGKFMPPANPEAVFRTSLAVELRKAGGPFGVPHPLVLQHFRLVRESLPDGRDGAMFAQLFELVPGVEVRGQSSPGALVTIAGTVATGPRDAFPYRTEIRADANGDFTWRIPYGRAHVGKIGFTDGCLVTSEGRVAKLFIDEADVVGGKSRRVVWEHEK